VAGEDWDVPMRIAESWWGKAVMAGFGELCADRLRFVSAVTVGPVVARPGLAE
jgi:hypothetical protein